MVNIGEMKNYEDFEARKEDEAIRKRNAELDDELRKNEEHLAHLRTPDGKVEALRVELNYIEDSELRDSAVTLVTLLPDYFFTVPASSTGKYHPKYALGTGGLLRHTKVAVRTAVELYNNQTFTGKYDSIEKDLAIIALILHDGIKHGMKHSKYTVTEHPELACDFVLGSADMALLSDSDAQFIADLIHSHMGQWNYDYKTKKEVLPKPETSLQKFVHLCDYIASRKVFEVAFVDGEVKF